MKKKFDDVADAYSMASVFKGKKKKSIKAKARTIGKSKVLGMGYSAGKKKKPKKADAKVEVPVAAAERGADINADFAEVEKKVLAQDGEDIKAAMDKQAKSMQDAKCYRLQMVWSPEFRPVATAITIGALPSTRIWKTNDGREMQVKDMTDTHLLNVLFKLKRTAITKHLEFIDKTNQTRSSDFDMLRSIPKATVDLTGNEEKRPEKTPEEMAAKTDIATGTSWKSFVSGDYFALYLEAERRDVEGAKLRPYLNRLVGSDAVRMAQ